MSFLSKEEIKSIKAKYGRKITSDLIEEVVKTAGGILLTDAADSGCGSKLNVSCKNGHIWETSWSRIQSGKWCPYCAKNKVEENDVIRTIEEKGGIFSKDFKYVNSVAKFTITCKNGHLFETYWSNVNSGYWCPYCAKNRVNDKNVMDVIHNKGGILDSGWEYTNNKTEFFVTCTKGHRFITTWERIQMGCWCPYCSRNIVNVTTIIETIRNKGGVLDDGWVYINNREKFWITCKNKHRFRTKWDVISQGHWCPYCVGLAVNEADVRKVIEDKGGLLDNGWRYINSGKRFVIVCKRGHKFETRWSMVESGYWCPYCFHKTQEEFRGVIEKFFNKSFLSKWPKWLINTKGKRLQLDGYNEELKIAFEYQGYQHYILGYFDKNDENRLKKRKEHDSIKKELCKKFGITLVIVPYYVPKNEWLSLIQCYLYPDTSDVTYPFSIANQKPSSLLQT